MTRQQPNEASKRATLYVRISRLNQPGGIEALQAQVDRCTTYCLEHGYIVPQDQRYTVLQAGSAGSHRPALVRLGDAVQQGDVAVVVVSSLDRLARDSRQNVIFVEEFKIAGVTIATAEE